MMASFGQIERVMQAVTGTDIMDSISLDVPCDLEVIPNLAELGTSNCW